MAQLNLLQIVQAVTGELGLVQPAVVVGATDLQTVQLFNLVNRCGDDCPGPARWSSAAATTDPRWAALKTLTPLSSPTTPSQAPAAQPSPPPPSPN